MGNRKGEWIQTFSGVEFWPLDPRPCEIRTVDIAHSLSMQCRYAGHTRSFYSVAEHSIRVSELCPPEDALWGLLHDASEAYLIDLPRPIKAYSEIGRLYSEVEKFLMQTICERYGLSPVEPESCKRADKAMLWVESQSLMQPSPAWQKWREFSTGIEQPILWPLPPGRAEDAFLARYEVLGGVVR